MFIVIIDDDEEYLNLLRKRLEPFLAGNRLQLRSFRSPGAALEFVEAEADRVALILTDYRMPEMDGLEFIHRLEKDEHDYQLILCCASVDQELTRSLPHLNIFDVFEKTEDFDDLLGIVAKAVFFFQEKRKQKTRIAEMLGRFRREEEPQVEDLSFHGIVGNSPAVRALIEKIKQAAGSQATCLVQGESGTGKELVARALHEESSRRGRPFQAINCAAIPHELFESELFGHVKGAFTGAAADKTGIIEQARDGTLFLDEIGEMPADMQAKLLRFLQEGTVRKIGAADAIAVPVRVVAATNRNLQRAIRDRSFREDLFYRINVVPIDVPPLRERPADIGLLSLFFLRIFCELEKKPIRILTGETVRILSEYYWPGNVRELRNLMHRLVIFSKDVEIGPEELPDEILNDDFKQASGARPPEVAGAHDAGDPAPLNLADRERQSLVRALGETGGNKVQTARLLGISRASLYRKLKKYGLDES